VPADSGSQETGVFHLPSLENKGVVTFLSPPKTPPQKHQSLSHTLFPITTARLLTRRAFTR